MLEIGRGVAGRDGRRARTAWSRSTWQQAARKRVGYLVQPARIISWDHRKLVTPAAP